MAKRLSSIEKVAESCCKSFGMSPEQEKFLSTYNATKLYGSILAMGVIPKELHPELRRLIASTYEPVFKELVKFIRSNGGGYSQNP